MNRNLALAGLFIVALLAASAMPAHGQNVRRMLRDYQQKQQNIQELFDAGQYEKAAAACQDMLKEFKDDPTAYYNLACAKARLKQPEEALKQLAKAVENGWYDADHMQADEDLTSIRGDKKFTSLVADSRMNERAGGAKYEKGADIPDVKTVEDFPEDGLRFRLRIPKTATEKKPARLLIWLHPSGSSMNAEIEQLAPQFAAHGYALMVFPHKQYLGWADDEADALVSHTLPALKAYKEIDATRPVLMGYSAGGQMALSLWQTNPSAWGGLILDAAYPIVMQRRPDQSPNQPPNVIGMDLPSNAAAVKKTPLRIVVGENDGPGLRRWEQVENKWLGAGVPLTLSKIPEKGREWLLTGDPLSQTLNWLDELKAGKLPAEPAKPRELEI